MRGGGGDVKYHIGYDKDHVHEDGSRVRITLTANPSHLESVDPVVEGRARALQDLQTGHDRSKVVPVLLHGDAAFAGQGIVAETLNLSHLDGYRTGGTIHIIINNQIGFTTPSKHARSSVFCTDVAKMLPIPVFHVNGDDPESLVYVVDLALQYRQTFHEDCVIDVFCFRRHGHNEGDEPSFTHPGMYRIIKSHPGVATLYGDHCVKEGVLSADAREAIITVRQDELKQALVQAKVTPVRLTQSGQGSAWEGVPRDYSRELVATGVSAAVLKELTTKLLESPDGFSMHPKLRRILDRKRKVLEEGESVDWAMAESLAFGSLVLEGTPVRLSGEDSARGTFSQRHLMWWDAESDKPKSYCPLHHVSPDQAEFGVYDSPLSEYSILGFEYGYHADYTYDAKYGIRAPSGGGRASARETIGRVAAAAVAKQVLDTLHPGIEILAWVKSIQELNATVDPETVSSETIESNIVRTGDPAMAETMIERIKKIRADGNSVGGVIECVIRNCPPGLGEPIFDKLEAELAKAMLSIPATKGFEIGSGFQGTLLTGSEHNDPFRMVDGKVRTTSNRSGGVQGGISNGENILFRVAFKPTATIMTSQETVTSAGENTELAGKGRHDACVLPRAVPIVEAMATLVLTDHLLRQKSLGH